MSEALYLRDPEGNGIEIYRDRPREEWRRDGGELAMATLPLDLESVLGELGNGEQPADGMPAGTTMGHVHLLAADIPSVEGFYNGALGLDVMVRSYPGALFLSAGGYHHHLGLNTWQSQGAPPPPEGALGLDHYELVLPSAAERDSAADRLAQAGADPQPSDEGVLAADPSGNRVLLTARVLADSRKPTRASSSRASIRLPKSSGISLKPPSPAGDVICAMSVARVWCSSRLSRSGPI